MREVIFRRQNKGKWEKLETILDDRKNSTSDQLAAAYIEINNDLSYASTYYPKSVTHTYLNSLAARMHTNIYINKKEKKGRFLRFFKNEIPLIVRKHHDVFLVSLSIFLLFLFLGALSQHYDHSFIRTIIGDRYVDMTLENIKAGNPTAVYQDEAPFFMFLRIFFNNLMVDFLMVACGVIVLLGPLHVFLRNGIMIGCFLYFFPQQGVMAEALPDVFIHGTIELFTVVISGAAGLIISKSIMFPGTYSRLTSFMSGVKDAAKIMVAVIPFTFVAAFFEGYVTRFAFMPSWLAALIILGSLALVIFYFVIHPIRVSRALQK